MISIDRRRLEPLKPLGEGGMAQVYRVGGSVPQLGKDLAFKELKPTVVEPNRSQMLDGMRKTVMLRAAMNPKEQAELDEVTVWPIAMVTDQGKDVGLIMRCIPPDYFITDNNGPRVFEFQLLGAADDQAQKNGFDKSRAPADKPLVRLALMARLAYAMEVIHRPRGGQRLVYGDVNLRNAAVAIGPPRIILMDCDGVADVTDGSRVQPNTPFFVPPEKLSGQQRLQDQVTDVYKLGLCIIRGLARGRGSTQLTDPASSLIPPGLLDPAGIDLLERAVGADRSRRPTAEELKDYLIGRVLDLADPPTLLSADLSSNVALRGSEVFVHWAHKGGTSVRVFSTVGNFTKTVGADAYPNGYPIMPPTAGEIRVAVVNDHGEDEGPAGYLHYFEVPPLKISVEPPPVSLPDLPAMRLPTIRPELPAYPMLSAEAVPVPDLRWPRVPAVDLAAVTPGNPLVNGLSKVIGHAYRAADAGIDRTVREAIRRRARKMRVAIEKNNP